MRTQRDAAGIILDRLHADERSIAWLSREARIPYKKLLRELKHKPETLTMFHSLMIVEALEMDLAAFLEEVAA